VGLKQKTKHQAKANPALGQQVEAIPHIVSSRLHFHGFDLAPANEIIGGKY